MTDRGKETPPPVLPLNAAPTMTTRSWLIAASLLCAVGNPRLCLAADSDVIGLPGQPASGTITPVPPQAIAVTGRAPQGSSTIGFEPANSFLGVQSIDSEGSSCPAALDP